MAKLTDFSWLSFLGAFPPRIVARLGHEWGIDDWKRLEREQTKSATTDLKHWVQAIQAISEDRQAEMVDLADQIKTVGDPEGRKELIQRCPKDWLDKYLDKTSMELSALAFLEQEEYFLIALSWVEVWLADKWEYYQASSKETITIGEEEIRYLEEIIGDYWRERKLGKRCMVTSLHKDPVSVITIGYEQEPVSIREFDDKSQETRTRLRLTHPVREALIKYDRSTGALQVRMYKMDSTKCDHLVRTVSNICFKNADLFPTGTKREARYDLKAFTSRPSFLAELDQSTGLDSVNVTKLVLEPAKFESSRVELRCSSKKLKSSNKDVYDILGSEFDFSGWRVIQVEMKAYFQSGRRKMLKIELKDKGGATRAGDSRYEIIENHLKRWKVVK